MREAWSSRAHLSVVAPSINQKIAAPLRIEPDTPCATRFAALPQRYWSVRVLFEKGNLFLLLLFAKHMTQELIEPQR